MQVTIVSLGLYEGSGGPSKSIRSFRAALDANVITWIDPYDAYLGKPAFQDATFVRGGVSRKLLFASRRSTEKAEKVVQSSDIVSCHSYFRYHNQWVRTVCRDQRKPYWFVPHGSLDPWVFQKSGLVKKLYQATYGARFLKNATAGIFSTKREQEKAQHLFNPPLSKVAYWPLNPDDFRERDDEARVRFRKELNIPEDALVLLYFGRLDSMKRPLETIRAVAAAREDKCHLIVAGNAYGVTEAECLALANRLGVSHFVHVLGAIYGSRKADLFSASDVYISLSHRENFNFCAAESIAAGLPVILSSGNDLLAEIEHTTFCTAIADADIVEAAVDAIKTITKRSAAELRKAGSQGRQWAVENLSYEQFKNQIVDFARNVIIQYGN